MQVLIDSGQVLFDPDQQKVLVQPNCCQGVSGSEWLDLDVIHSVVLTYTFSGSYAGEVGCDAYTFDESCTFSFTQIPYDQAFGYVPGVYEFKCAIVGAPGGCNLFFRIDREYPTGITCQPLGVPTPGQIWIHLLDVLTVFVNQEGDPTCPNGTVDFCSDAGGSVEVWRVRDTDPQDFCGGLECSFQPGTICSLQGIPWNLSDMTVMYGTYSMERTCTLPHGSITIGLAVTIS